MNSEYEEVITTTSKLLKNKIFSGVYKERRLIEIGSLATYKDVIVVDKSEYDFIRVLRKVNVLLKNKCYGLLATCISESASQCSIWTNLNNVAFGPHWFQIKNISVNQNTVNIRVKCLRPINLEQQTSSFFKEPIFDWNSFSINSAALKNIGRNLSDVITKHNIVQFSRCMLVVLLAIAMGCYQLLLALLQLIHELNFLIRSMIPFMIVCVENLTKAFGGLLILITMMWKTPKRYTWTGRNISGSPMSAFPKRCPTMSHQNTYAHPYNIQNRGVSYSGNAFPRQVQY